MAQFLRHRSRLSCNTVVHATRVAVSPVDAAFERHWPEAETIQLLDESLARDLDAIGHLTPELSGRIGRLAEFAERGGAAAILFSCSAFGPAIEAVQARLPLPVLKPNQAMLEEALAQGGRIHILSTFKPSAPSMRKELEPWRRIKISNLQSTHPTSQALWTRFRRVTHRHTIRSSQKPQQISRKPTSSCSPSSPWRARWMRSPAASMPRCSAAPTARCSNSSA